MRSLSIIVVIVVSLLLVLSGQELKLFRTAVS